MKVDDFKFTRPSIIKLIYNISYTVHQIFEENSLEYWASGGTFLGLIRHKGIIPWDDDCDLCVYDQKKFLSLVPQIEKCGLRIVKVFFGYKIMYKNRKNFPGENFSFPNVDIFIMRLNESQRPYFELKYKSARDWWPQEKYYIDEHYPLVKYKFGDGEMYGSRRPEKYFDRMYGEDWNIVAYREFDHETDEIFDKVKVVLTDRDRVPALPVPKYTRKRCVSKNKKTTPVKRSRRTRRTVRSRRTRRTRRSRNYRV